MSFPENSPTNLHIGSLQVLLLDYGYATTFDKLDWESRANSLGLTIFVNSLPVGSDWGQSLEQAITNIPCPWVLLVPKGTSPDLLDWIKKNRELVEALDGVTFRRTGGKAPWIMRLLSWCFLQPFRFLLEIPLAKNNAWLGFSNWKWEQIGYWLLGVHNKDPLNPIRLLRTAWFQKIPMQSKTAWGNLEMLAKAHFLGMRLAEEICPVEVNASQLDPREWADLKGVLNKPIFTKDISSRNNVQSKA